MRKLIAGMKLSLDGMVSGPEDMADWVDAWSEDYGLTPEIDACLLGGGMFPGYENYWTALRADPAISHWIHDTRRPRPNWPGPTSCRAFRIMCCRTA